MNSSLCKYNEECTLDGCIFGWVLFKDVSVPIAHHAGIIARWNQADPWMSIVIHYGSDCTSRILIETLKDAVIRSDVKVVKLNPHYHAVFNEKPFVIDNDGNLTLSNEILSYGEEHPEYNVVTSNCQHFVRRFIPGIPIESDLLSDLRPICTTLLHTVVFGKQKDIDRVIEDVAGSYHNYRERGICAWHPDLDLDVPIFK